MRLVRVALAHQDAGVSRRRGLVRAGRRAGREAREQLVDGPSPGRSSRLPTRNAPPPIGRPAAVAERDDPLARERVADVLGGPEHRAAERVVAERRLVDQVLGHHRGLVVGARDLLHDHAALAVELVGVDPRAADEVRQQVGRLERLARARGDVERDQVVAGVGVEDRADPLGGLVDVPVGRVLLAALEHEVLEEMGHPVLVLALGTGARRRTRPGSSPSACPRPRSGTAGARWAEGVCVIEATAEQKIACPMQIPLAKGGIGPRSGRASLRCAATYGYIRHPSSEPGGGARAPRPAVIPRARGTARRAGSVRPAGDRVPRRLQALFERRHRPRPGHVLDRPRRVRVPRRLHRLGQVDRDAAADQGARPDRRDDPRRRPRPERDHAQADPVLPPQHRRRVPGLQAAPEPDRVRQRRLRAPGHGRHAPGDPRQGAGHPAADRPLDEAPQLPRPALGRRAAARLDRARVRQPPAAAAGRRADRKPRPGDEHRHHAAALPDQPDRHDRARRHPRPGDGRQDAPPRARALARAGSSATRPPACTRATRPRASSRSGCASPDASGRRVAGGRPSRTRCSSGSSCARRCARCGATPRRASPRSRPCS